MGIVLFFAAWGIALVGAHFISNAVAARLATRSKWVRHIASILSLLVSFAAMIAAFGFILSSLFPFHR